MFQNFLGDFLSHHGFRWYLVINQLIADDLAREIHMIALGMGAGFVIGNRVAFFAEKEAHKKNGGNAQVRKKIKYFLGGKRMVITAHAGMVAADNEVGAAEIFANNGVEYRFLGAGITHFSLQDGHDGPFFDVKPVNQHFVGVEDHLVREIAGFFLADDRVDEQTVHDGLSRFLNVFVPEVRNVAGLKTNHGFPFFFLEQHSGFPRG